ncbi:MAG: CvpA family protein [Treponema sp.]|nr:CvpA family protein [Treponema sp.]
MQLVDIFIIVIILVFGLIGTAKGFLKEIFGKASLLFSILGGLAFYPKLNPYLAPYIKNELFCNIVCFLLIFVIIFLVIMIVHAIVDRIFSGQIFKGLDRALGFLLGLVEGAFVCIVLIMLLQLCSFIDTKAIFHDSFFYKLYLSYFGSHPIRFGGIAA